VLSLLTRFVMSPPRTCPSILCQIDSSASRFAVLLLSCTSLSDPYSSCVNAFHTFLSPCIIFFSMLVTTSKASRLSTPACSSSSIHGLLSMPCLAHLWPPFSRSSSLALMDSASSLSSSESSGKSISSSMSLRSFHFAHPCSRCHRAVNIFSFPSLRSVLSTALVTSRTILRRALVTLW